MNTFNKKTMHSKQVNIFTKDVSIHKKNTLIDGVDTTAAESAFLTSLRVRISSMMLP